MAIPKMLRPRSLRLVAHHALHREAFSDHQETVPTRWRTGRNVPMGFWLPSGVVEHGKQILYFSEQVDKTAIITVAEKIIPTA